LATSMSLGAVIVPGGKPVTAVPGLSPRSAPVITVGPVLVTVLLPKTPKHDAVPSAKVAGGGQAAPVVNVQTTLAPSGLPKVSTAPVVIVAVNGEFAASGTAGVNVAVLVAPT
jgi:hypothetical protein